MKKDNRKKIIEVLDHEDAWNHVIMHYVAHQRNHGYMMKWRKDGNPDLRYNVSRIVARLNSAIGNVMLAGDPKNPPKNEE